MIRGEHFMKIKWAISSIFILTIVLISTAAFAGGYGRGYGHGYGRHGYYRHGYYRQPHGYYNGNDLFIGTMFGFTLGALLWSPPPPVYVYREYPRTIVYRETYIYKSPRSGFQSDPSSIISRRSSAAASCLQTREYTATMVIEGKTVQAYGTRCLQPDGSWRYGPAQPVPDFR